MQHRREIRFLLAGPLSHHAFAGEAVCHTVHDIAGIRVRHGRGGLVHGIADQHQRFVSRSFPVGGDEISHRVIADVGKAHAAQARLDRRGDEPLEQRLVLQQLGLRAWHLDERDQQFLCAIARDALLQQFLELDFVHRRFPLSSTLGEHRAVCGTISGLIASRGSSRHFGAAVAEPLLHPRPQHQDQADREDRRRQGPQDEDGVVVVGNHQRLMERPLGEPA